MGTRTPARAGGRGYHATAAAGRHAHLPRELLQNVFSHLPRESQLACARVCRSWCGPALRAMYQQATGPFREPEQFLQFARCASDVRQLDLIGLLGGGAAPRRSRGAAPGADDRGGVRDALSAVLRKSPRIVRLVLPGLGAAVDDDVAELISTDRLEELDIAGSSVSDDGIRRMCAPKGGVASEPGTTGCPRALRVLCIDNCARLTKNSLEAMARWPALIKVSVRGYNPNFTGKAIRDLQRASLGRFLGVTGDDLPESLVTEYTGIEPGFDGSPHLGHQIQILSFVDAVLSDDDADEFD